MYNSITKKKMYMLLTVFHFMRSKRKYLAIALSLVMVGAAYFLVNPVFKTAPTGPLVTGYISYEDNSISPDLSGTNNTHAAVGTIEAYMPVLPSNASELIGNGKPMIVNSSYDCLGVANISNGNFSLPLSHTFFSIVNSWVHYYSHFNVTIPDAFLMLEINIPISNNNVTDLYTFAYSDMFDAKNITLDHPTSFHIQKNFVLQKPSAVIENNVTASPAGLIGGGGSSGWTSRTITTYTWVNTGSHAFANTPLPLLITTNLTALDLSNGYLQGDAILGMIGDTLSFTSSQAYGSSSGDISNINDWNFQSSTSNTLSLPNGFIGNGQLGLPQAGADPSYSTAVIGLSGVVLNLEVSKLKWTTTKYVYFNDVLQMQDTTITSGWTGDEQVQQYLTSQGTGFGEVTNYYPSWFAIAIQWMDNNQTTQMGTLWHGTSIGFDALDNQLSDISNDVASTISNVADIAIASIGTIVAIAAAAEAMSLGTAGPVAALAEIVAMTGVIGSVVAAATGIEISTSSLTTIYTSAVASDYTQPLSTSVIVNPSVVQIDGYSLTIASPLVEVST